MSGKSLTYPFLMPSVIFDRASLIGLCPVLTILLDAGWYADITLTWVLYLLSMCFLRPLFSDPPLKMIIGTIPYLQKTFSHKKFLTNLVFAHFRASLSGYPDNSSLARTKYCFLASLCICIILMATLYHIIEIHVGYSGSFTCLESLN